MRLMYVSYAKQVLVSAGKLPALAFAANEQSINALPQLTNP